MADDFLSMLLGNPQRARILRVFALNQPQAFTLVQVAKRSGVGRPTTAREVRALEKMGVIKKAKFSIQVGRGKRIVSPKQKEETWAFNPEFLHAGGLLRFIQEVSPVQHKKILDTLRGAGRISAVILSGGFVGDLSRPADMLLAIDALNERRLESAVRALEPSYGREIRYAVFSTPEFRYRLTIEDRLMRDTLDYPHLVLLDKLRLL